MMQRIPLIQVRFIEIESFILFLIASVLFSGAIITDAVNKVRKKLDSESEEEDTALNRWSSGHLLVG